MVSFRFKKALLASIFIIIFFPKVHGCGTTSYIGFDHQLNRMRFKEGYGQNLFSKHYPQANFYGGIKLIDQLVLEIGYVSTVSKHKFSTLNAGDIALGAHIPHRLSPIRFLSHIKIRGYHLSLVNFYSPVEWKKWRLMGGIGLSFLRAEAERYTISIGNNFNFQSNTRTFKKQKAVLRLILAPEYRFQDNVGIRTSFCFINTSKMQIKADPVGNSYTPIIRPKDSLIFSLGVFFEF